MSVLQTRSPNRLTPSSISAGKRETKQYASLSPSRRAESSSSMTALSMLDKNAVSTTSKTKIQTPGISGKGQQQHTPIFSSNYPQTPFTPKEVHNSHHIDVSISTITLQNSRAKFNNTLSLKVLLDGESKNMSQKNFVIKDGLAKYEVGDTCLFNTKGKHPILTVEILIGSNVLASGSISIDVAGNLDRPRLPSADGKISNMWNKVKLEAVMDTSKHVLLTEVVGEMELAFEVRSENFWDDSESEGSKTNSTVTSATNTPASLVGSSQKSVMGSRSPPKRMQTPSMTCSSTPSGTPALTPVSLLTPLAVVPVQAETVKINEENKANAGAGAGGGATKSSTPMSVTSKAKAKSVSIVKPVHAVRVPATTTSMAIVAVNNVASDIANEDAAEAETTKVPSIVENSVLVEAETPLISVPESVVPVSAPAKRTFEVTAENAMKSVAAVVVVGLLISFVSSAIKKK